MVNSKKKGNAWENRLARWLSENGIRASRDAASGGGSREKGDILNSCDLTIESKAAKTIKLMEWWKQTERAASIHHNSPVLFIHQDGMREDEWLVVMNNYDWIAAMKGENAGKMTHVSGGVSKSLYYAAQSLRTALSRFTKELDSADMVN